MIWIFDLAEDRNTNITELTWPGASSSRCHANLKPRIDLECYSSTMLSLTLARSMKNKTGSHQCTRAVCSIVAGIRSTLTPRCIDALFGVSPEYNPDSSPPVQRLHRSQNARGKLISETYLSCDTRNAWSFYLVFLNCQQRCLELNQRSKCKIGNTKEKKKKTKPILWLGAFGPSNKKSVYSLLDPALKSETHLLEFSIVTYVVKNQIRWVLIY